MYDDIVLVLRDDWDDAQFKFWTQQPLVLVKSGDSNVVYNKAKVSHGRKLPLLYLELITAQLPGNGKKPSYRYQKGIAFADIATKEGEQENYKKAFENYISAAEWLLLAKRHGNMNEDTKVMITRKAESYINRAEQIKKLLLSENSKKKAVAFQGSIVSETKVSFHDVVGLDQAKEALIEAVILPIKFPRLFTGKAHCSEISLEVFTYSYTGL
ncbi:unnamed protein product [Didymodactylos carnosus]|uniref:MIT domain-containing protein n=1 Tax=Didymodactylos carnosus TaxID=1234261 RepID=A0A8S2SI94_9BILA|nr:unnamed protein product [Didymodactylos carnosus]CAF4203172.1 unnamed protein product [Didymodactylos carnosus]